MSDNTHNTRHSTHSNQRDTVRDECYDGSGMKNGEEALRVREEEQSEAGSETEQARRLKAERSQERLARDDTRETPEGALLRRACVGL